MEKIKIKYLRDVPKLKKIVDILTGTNRGGFGSTGE